jgi:hypothetical protein
LRNKRKVKKRMRLVENVEIPRCVYIVSWNWMIKSPNPKRKVIIENLINEIIRFFLF